VGRGDWLYPGVVAEGGDLRASNPRALRRPVSVVITIVALVASAVLVTPVTANAAGHARRHMPDLIGLSRAQVFAVMRADALYFVTTGPGSSNGTWKEAVAQSPRPGTVVPWHFQATVRVSTANPHAARRVPRLIGLSRARTYAVMKRAQLFFSPHGPGSTDGKWIVVLRQSPKAGALVRWHATVSLAVSTKRPKKPVKRPVTTTTKPKPVCTPVTTTTPPTTTTVVATTIPGETTTTTTPPSPVTTSTICKVPVTTTTRPPKKKPVKYRIGDATWYRYIPNHCATWYLPRGTRVTVRDLRTGKVIHCIASDREAAHGDRVVDLDTQQFAELAPLSQGVIAVKVSW
jgi:beta-lactam-binding protein with PASTA domain